MGSSRSAQLRRACGDDGVVIVIIAALIASLLVVASLVIDLGGARHARERDQDGVDAMALAGAAKLDASSNSNQGACTAAWSYAVSNFGVAATPAPSCVSMAGACDASTAREVSVTRGDVVFTMINPVPDGHPMFTAQPVTSSDNTPCNRFGVTITRQWRYTLQPGATALTVSAMARLANAPGSVVAPLILLDPHGCDVLTVGGSAVMDITTTSGTPAYIAVDSDGVGCPSGTKVIVDTVGSGKITSGVISMWALTTGNTARAYDPADVGVGRGFNPAPVASSQPVTRNPIDWKFNCLPSNGCPTGNPSPIQNLVTAQGGTGSPGPGWTTWSSVYSCSPSGNIIVPKGNWYIDCPSGLSTGANITFRGGNIGAARGLPVWGEGTLRVHADVAPVRDNCPATTMATSTFFLRSGNITKTGNNHVWMMSTFVYLANGTLNLTGNSELVWSAPQDPTSPFYDLLVWTESSAPLALNGTSDLNVQGILFAPNGTLTLSGTAGTTALQSQMWIRKVALSGSSNLTLSPRADQILALGGAGSSLIR
ncbi:MAG: hypothetical protein QOF97_144 [Acidimicrobiaceae bacterium]